LLGVQGYDNGNCDHAMFNPNSEVWTLVLDPSAFVAAKRARLSRNYSVQLC